MFLIGYGVFRFIAEYFRNPDPGIFGLDSFGVSMGQWLSLPMIAAGLAMLAWSYAREGKPDAGR
jgi:phosphatidylglycerol:prolipoprotein diacylglycerol transferase